MKNIYETPCFFGKCSIGFDTKASKVFIKTDDYNVFLSVSPNDVKDIAEMFDGILSDLKKHLAKPCPSISKK